jgi:single-strand DNA-binding protein
MNTITLIGRLTRDPEIKYTPKGTALTTFTLAVNRPKAEGREQEADFIKIVAWQKTAENCANYLKKGCLCAIQGRLQIQNYETQDGQKKKEAAVIAGFVQFLEKKGSEPAAATGGDNDLSGVNLDDLPF